MAVRHAADPSVTRPRPGKQLETPPDGSILSGICFRTMLIHPLPVGELRSFFPDLFTIFFCNFLCSFGDR